MITIYSVAYNEELHIQHMIDHYRSRFPNCNIVIYDNMSTDNTKNIAEQNCCNVVSFDTNNQFQDRKHIDIKNNCWKDANTDWVLMCDMDELLDINQEQLQHEDKFGITMIKSAGYNMINMEDNLDISNIKYGVRAPRYDKPYLFNRKFIQEINYEVGCHACQPSGHIVYSDNVYKAYHFNFINLELSFEKYKRNASRLSPENIHHGWGNHYLLSEEKIKEEFMDLRRDAIRLIL